MRCPFLKKMNVKYCGLRRSRMIPLRTQDRSMDLCSGPGYADCFLLDGHRDVPRDHDHCPHLSVGDAHYCELDPAQKLIPCNQASMSRCHDEGHRYCSLYLSASRSPDSPGDDATETVDSLATRIPLPGELAFTPNHMWYDHGDGGTCHLGVDAFFTSMVEDVESFAYTCHAAGRRPAVRFVVGGVDFDFVFPWPMQEIEINPHHVVDPAAILADPYGRGWLFEGPAPAALAPSRAHDRKRDRNPGLLRGREARLWMVEECDRLSVFVHDHLRPRDDDAGPLAHDGGAPHHPLTGACDRGSLVRLHHDFFTNRPGGATP